MTLGGRLAAGFVLALSGLPAALLAQEPAARPAPTDAPIFRGDLRRTGVYHTRGVRELHGLKWQFKVGDGKEHSLWCPPIVADGTVFVGSVDNQRATPKYLHAIDLETGKEKWHFATDPTIDGQAMLGDIQGFPQYADGMIYFATESGTLYALDARTGEERWRRKQGTSDAAVAGATAYFVSGSGIHAVDAKTGGEKWTCRMARLGAATALALADDVLYFVNHDGTLYAFDLNAREVKWQAKTAGGVGGCPILAAPAVVDGTVYVGSRERFVALDAGTGREKWTFATGRPLYCAPAVADGTLYLVNNDGEGFLYALDAATGREKWKFAMASPGWSSPTVADGMVYCVGYSGDFHALDAKTGEEKWKFKVEPHVSSPITVADGVITFGNWKGWLFALH